MVTCGRSQVDSHTENGGEVVSAYRDFFPVDNNVHKSWFIYLVISIK